MENSFKVQQEFWVWNSEKELFEMVDDPTITMPEEDFYQYWNKG